MALDPNDPMTLLLLGSRGHMAIILVEQEMEAVRIGFWFAAR